MSQGMTHALEICRWVCIKESTSLHLSLYCLPVDGETFQIKKSSKSRKLVKRLKNEKKMEKDEESKQIKDGRGKVSM